MKYIINSLVIFDTIEYNLSLFKKKNKHIKLSHSAGRVLEELIKFHKNSSPISREYLFKNIWIIHGLQPSNGNLNQQISLIRKGLKHLGLNSSVIVTIPKKGLKLNDKLKIKKLEKNNAKDFIIDEISSSFKKRTLFNLSRINFKYKIIFSLISFIILFIFFSMFYSFKYKNNLNQKLYFFDQVNSCKVYTFHPISILEKKEYDIKVAAAFEENDYKCKKNYIVIISKFVVSDDNLMKEDKKTNTFIEKCFRDKNERILNCLNLFFVS
ncbi:yqeI [Wigglesworthia glossinidia endosymbiont of Glossina brevipalpis]|uniref:YqeI protein n=1 Tax=Wigglesworthia glossinidia brevipalpis TaxID=36870 RepID=Q8D287_WIGBR|nr:yqeI [Wigglesworthia glossinidia endosymbiont of Glossina brevipalpis]